MSWSVFGQEIKCLDYFMVSLDTRWDTLNLNMREQRQDALCEFQASLVYIVSSRAAKAT